MDGVCIVALPIGDKTVTYKDGDTAPLHQTLVWLGNKDDINEKERFELVKSLLYIAEKFNPILAKIVGHGYLGKDPDSIVITESWELTQIRDGILGVGPIYELMVRIPKEQRHPNWISHVSYSGENPFTDVVVFDRLALWYGDSRHTFPLKLVF